MSLGAGFPLGVVFREIFEPGFVLSEESVGPDPIDVIRIFDGFPRLFRGFDRLFAFILVVGVHATTAVLARRSSSRTALRSGGRFRLFVSDGNLG